VTAPTDAYPATWEADVVLRDGHTVRVRPILPDDVERLRHFHERQSPESVYFRFFSPRPTLSERELRYFTHLDHHDRVAFVALLEDEIVGVARYERYKDTDTAEVAFFVDDEHNGRGLATVLLEFLAAAGRHRGLRRFTASTLPSNRRMLAVFASAGFEVSSHLEDGVIYVTFDIHPTDESVRLADHRRRTAEAASVQRMLRPASVAVIGLAQEAGLGALVLRSLVEHGYRGELVAVAGPGDGAGDGTGAPARAAGHAELVAVPGGVVDVGGTAVPGGVAVVDEVPESTDLAVIAVAAAAVPEVVERCGARGVGAVVVLSAGFAETGLDGAALQWEVMEAARRHGIRVLGPNCLGLVNTDPEVRLHATVAPGTPPAGRIGMLAESGSLAAAIIDHAERSRLGMSTFVAAGNPADISAADLLSYWADDEHTSAVLLYLRSSRLPSRLVRAARAASLAKPVAVLGNVLVTGGSADTTMIRRRVEALTRQTGVISVGTLEQLFDIGRLLSDQPAPGGSGVAVVGNSDGAVAIAADACRGAGLEVVDLARPPAPGVPAPGARPRLHNPVDLGYAATAEDYADALASVAAHPGVHSVIVVHTPPRHDPTDRVVEAIVAASAAHPGVTFAATMLGAAGTPRLDGAGNGVPIFRFPEHAAWAIGRLAGYRIWRGNAIAHGMPDTVGSQHDAALDVVVAALARRSGVGGGEVGGGGQGGGGRPVALDLGEQERLLAAYSVPVAPREVVGGPDAAVAAAERIGWPVALKAATRDRSTRSAASGVAIDIAGPVELRGDWERMTEVLGDGMHPTVVQRFIERGVDASVVLRRSEGGSATIEVGLGGPVTAFDEPQLGILPLTLADAQSLVANSALGRALTDPLDRVALIGVVHRLASMVEEIEEIDTLEADPIVASVEGAWVADVHIEVSPTGDRLAVRRLD